MINVYAQALLLSRLTCAGVSFLQKRSPSDGIFLDLVVVYLCCIRLPLDVFILSRIMEDCESVFSTVKDEDE